MNTSDLYRFDITLGMITALPPFGSVTSQQILYELGPWLMPLSWKVAARECVLITIDIKQASSAHIS